MSTLSRLWQNLFCGWGQLPRQFPPAQLDAIANAVAEGERNHRGQVCVAVESRLNPWRVLTGIDARQRAAEAFAHLRVWDTEDNAGVLVYVLLSERRIEILPDRGIRQRVAESEWRDVCNTLSTALRVGDWHTGLLAGIEQIHSLLRAHFPATASGHGNELSDRPTIL